MILFGSSYSMFLIYEPGFGGLILPVLKRHANVNNTNATYPKMKTAAISGTKSMRTLFEITTAAVCSTQMEMRMDQQTHSTARK